MLLFVRVIAHLEDITVNILTTVSANDKYPKSLPSLKTMQLVLVLKNTCTCLKLLAFLCPVYVSFLIETL